MMETLLDHLRARIRTIDTATGMARYVSSTIFPPAAVDLVDSAEQRLGFQIPALLRDIYTQVGNGGFGPGYGLVGLDGGAQDDQGGTIVDLYLLYKQGDPGDSHWRWPDYLLPVFYMGDAVYACIDCSLADSPVTIFDPNVHTEGELWDGSFKLESISLEEWLEDWLGGSGLAENYSALDKKLIKLLREGKKISAIILYQQEKRCSLQDARQYIQRLSDQVLRPGK